MKNRISTCPVCSSRDCTLRHKVQNFKYITCLTCGTVRIDPFPTACEVAAWYTIDNYYHNKDRNIGYTDYESLKPGLIKTSEKRFAKALHPEALRNASVLELGCGPGCTAEALKKFRNIEYLGVDPNPQAIDSIRKLGFKGEVGTIKDIDTSRKFDHIIFFDVLEHIIDPNHFFSYLNTHLKPSGTLLFTTPNTTSLLSKISGARWVSYIVPQHVLLYNPQSIYRLLVNHGYSNIKFFSDFQWVGLDFVLNRLGDLGDLIFPLKWIEKAGSGFLKKLPFVSVPNGNMLVFADKNN
ncbi:MAG: class I SAM-dependent methyltransferase [Thermodesulfobacteriota bacterium]|nr:class I SAM-dependent methyltransferase [Thermodesulfobacteriota bacterium]